MKSNNNLGKIYQPELEIVDKSLGSLRYLEHGWPCNLCRWHAHEEFELHLITSTYGKAFIGDYIGNFAPNTLYLVGAYVPHNWQTRKDQPPVKLRDMLVQFNHSSYAKVAKHYPELLEVESLLEAASFGIEFVGFDANHAKKVLGKIRDKKGMNSLLIFLDFLLELSRWPEQRLLAARPCNQVLDDSKNKLSNVVEFVLDNYQNNLYLEDVAELAKMHPSSFSRFFQRTTGNKFTDFVTRVRIGHACELLMQTEQLVADIAEQAGFNNLANFNRQFQRVKSMSPTEYRKQARESLAERQLVDSANGVDKTKAVKLNQYAG